MKLVDCVHAAALHGHADVLRWLGKPKPLPIHIDSFVLHAIFSENIEVVKILLEMGCEVSSLALTVAQKRGWSDIAALLLSPSTNATAEVGKPSREPFQLIDRKDDAKVFKFKEANELETVLGATKEAPVHIGGNIVGALALAPHIFIFQKLIESKCIYFYLDAIYALTIGRGHWRLLKTILMAQHFPLFSTPPTNPNLREPFRAFEPTMSPNPTIPVALVHIYIAIARALGGADPKLLVWFFKRDWVDRNELQLHDLMTQRDGGIFFYSLPTTNFFFSDSHLSSSAHPQRI